MPLIRFNPEVARVALQNGALGIGEDHGEPEARQLALELINMGVVRHFFTELYEEHGNVEKLATARIAAASGDSLRVVESLCPSGFSLGNSITQGRVIARALQRGATVHLADTPHMHMGASRHAQRHQNILAKYRRATNQPGPAPARADVAAGRGCLLLWGGAHFEGANALENFIIGLPFMMHP